VAGETAQWRASRFVRLTKCYSGVQVKNDEMDGARGKYERDERCIQGSCGGIRGEGRREHLEDLGVDNIKWKFKK
jgi:hypothetical protein